MHIGNVENKNVCLGKLTQSKHSCSCQTDQEIEPQKSPHASSKLKPVYFSIMYS